MFASQKHKMGVLTRDEIGALFDVCDLAIERGRRDRVAVGLVLEVGLRAAEAVRLDWADVVWREIGGSLRTVLDLYGRGRRRRRRLVVGDSLATALEEWRGDGDRSGQVLRRVSKAGRVGAALTEMGFYVLIERLGQAAGLDDLRPGILRLTSACAQVRARGLEYASLALGDGDADRTRRSLAGCCGADEEPVTLLWTEAVLGGP